MVTLNSTILAIRAISAEFVHRIYIPVLILVSVVLAVLTIGSVYLTTLSLWWWLLAAVVFLWDLILGFALITIGAVINAFNPQQTKFQRTAVKSFVDKLQSLAEVTQTPKFILLFRIVRDVLAKKRGGFIESTVNDTASLRKDFSDIIASF